jgi:hypothetical protein
MELRDFQVFAGASAADQKPINEALFTTFEPIRLWSRARRVTAPFKKLVIMLKDTTKFKEWHGEVKIVEGVCAVTEAVALEELEQCARDHHWVLAIIKHALGCVAAKTGWRSEPLEMYIDELSAASLPLVFEFAALMARDEDRGVVCVPWFRTQPGLTEIGVRIQGIGEPCDVTLMHSNHPIYLEDDFPLAATRIKGSNLLLLDKKRSTIASIDLSGDNTQSGNYRANRWL